MQILGIVAGLLAAAASALSYLVSRHYGGRRPGGGSRLLVRAHVLMGLLSVPLAALLWPAALPPTGAWLPALAGSTACYLTGQVAVFAALQRIDASRLAPLLGLKIAMLAAIVTGVLGQELTVRQWLAVAASVAAAALVQTAGRPLPRSAIVIVVTACVLFAMSDLFIVALIDGLESVPPPAASLVARLEAGGFAVSITYVLCGVVACGFLPWHGGYEPSAWDPAARYAVVWMGAMLALYTCFGLVGAVFGNVLQSTRGVMAVGLGALLARRGWHDLEQPVDRRTLVRRMLAALLMTAAIAAYATATG